MNYVDKLLQQTEKAETSQYISRLSTEIRFMASTSKLYCIISVSVPALKRLVTSSKGKLY